MKASPAGGFRGGTRKGLDLTFGLKDIDAKLSVDRNHPTGGVLLRSMRRVNDGTVISGPSLLVDEILRVFDAPNLNTLVSETWNNQLFALQTPESAKSFSCMYLAKKDVYLARCDRMIYSSPRVGLDLSNPDTKASATDPRVTFVGKFHRFFRYPELLTKNGRLQTFVGLLCRSKNERSNETGIASLIAITGKYSEASVKKYTAEFRRGESSGRLEHFVGLSEKTTAPANYLRLMGTLYRMKII